MWDMWEDVKYVLLIICCKKGVEFFYSHETKDTQWEHPRSGKKKTIKGG